MSVFGLLLKKIILKKKLKKKNLANIEILRRLKWCIL